MSLDTQVKGSPASVRALGMWLRRDLAKALDAAGDSLSDAARAADGEWLGQTGEAFVAAARRGVPQVDDGAVTTRSVATTLLEYASGLEARQARMAALRDRARTGGLTVRGFVIEPPGAPPARPAVPEVASEGALLAYEVALGRWEQHQVLVELYDEIAERVAEVRSDHAAAQERVADVDRSLTGTQWTFVLADLAGGLVGERVAVLGSHWRVSAATMEASAQEHLRRLTRMESVPKGFAAQYYDDLRHWHEVDGHAKTDLVRGHKMQGISKGVPIGVGGVLAFAGYAYDRHRGESWQQAAASNGGSFLASVLAAGVVGSAGGPVGTVGGVVVGATVGIFTSSAIDGMWEHHGVIAEAAWNGLETFGDTGAVLSHGARSVGGALVKGIGWIL